MLGKVSIKSENVHGWFGDMKPANSSLSLSLFLAERMFKWSINNSSLFIQVFVFQYLAPFPSGINHTFQKEKNRKKGRKKKEPEIQRARKRSFRL